MFFIATGGTIDKQPVFLPDGSFDNESRVFGETYLPEMLKKARVTGNNPILNLFMIDSLDMTDDHRELIGDVIEARQDDKIVITHGTDTMPETAAFLARNKQLASRTIVLTGAMIPYSVGESSDALFNLGTAIAYAQASPSGVYVAMNGQAFAAGRVHKDRAAGIFHDLPYIEPS